MTAVNLSTETYKPAGTTYSAPNLQNSVAANPYSFILTVPVWNYDSKVILELDYDFAVAGTIDFNFYASSDASGFSTESNFFNVCAQQSVAAGLGTLTIPLTAYGTDAEWTLAKAAGKTKIGLTIDPTGSGLEKISGIRYAVVPNDIPAFNPATESDEAVQPEDPNPSGSYAQKLSIAGIRGDADLDFTTAILDDGPIYPSGTDKAMWLIWNPGDAILDAREPAIAEFTAGSSALQAAPYVEGDPPSAFVPTHYGEGTMMVTTRGDTGLLNPDTAPTLSSEAMPVPWQAVLAGSVLRGLTWDAANSRWLRLITNPTTLVSKVERLSGSPLAVSSTLTLADTKISYGLAVSGAFYYTMSRAANETTYKVHKWDASTGALSSTSATTFPATYGVPAVGVFGTDLYVASRTDATGGIRFTAINPSTLAESSHFDENIPGFVSPGRVSFVGRQNFDFGSERLLLGIGKTVKSYTVVSAFRTNELKDPSFELPVTTDANTGWYFGANALKQKDLVNFDTGTSSALLIGKPARTNRMRYPQQALYCSTTGWGMVSGFNNGSISSNGETLTIICNGHSNGDSAYAATTVSTSAAVEAGKYYAFAFDVVEITPYTRPGTFIRWYNASNVLVGTASYIAHWGKGRKAHTFIKAPAGAVRMQCCIGLHVQGAVTTHRYMRIHNVQCSEQGESLSYLDGDSTPHYYWAGTPHYSVAYYWPPVVADVASNRVPVEAGQTWTAKLKMKATQAALDATLSLLWYDASNVFISSDNTAITDMGTSWVQQPVTGVAPAGAKYVAAYYASQPITINQYINLDSGILEIGAGGTQFDGNTAPSGGNTYGWNGIPHQSSSYEVASGGNASALSAHPEEDFIAAVGEVIEGAQQIPVGYQAWDGSNFYATSDQGLLYKHSSYYPSGPGLERLYVSYRDTNGVV